MQGHIGTTKVRASSIIQYSEPLFQHHSKKQKDQFLTYATELRNKTEQLSYSSSCADSPPLYRGSTTY